jgi:hypothetical protein
MTEHPHEPDELEPDPNVPPRPEEEVADAVRQGPDGDPVAGGDSDAPPAQGEGRPDSH